MNLHPNRQMRRPIKADGWRTKIAEAALALQLAEDQAATLASRNRLTEYDRARLADARTTYRQARVDAYFHGGAA